MDFFQIGSGELFAWADFEQRSSCSLPPEKGRMTGVSHWLAWLSALYFNCGTIKCNYSLLHHGGKRQRALFFLQAAQGCFGILWN
jgi:hypothetical protein